MTSYNIYLDLKEPSAPPPPAGQAQVPQSSCLNVISSNSSKQQGLVRLGERYAKKYCRYSRILDRLVWLIACSSGLSIAAGISSMATLSTLVGLPVSIPLGAGSLARASVSEVAKH